MTTAKPHRIRIAYVMMSEVRAGVEEHVLSLVAGLDQKRFDPYVVAPPKLVEAFGRDLSDLDVTIHQLSIQSIWDVSNRVDFWRFLRANRIDIVNTHLSRASRNFTPLAILARVPVTMETAHGLEKWRLEGSWIKKKSFIVDKAYSLLQSRILAVSHACKRDLVSIAGIRPEKITVVQNGRSLDNFDPKGSEDRRRQYRDQYGIADDELVFGVIARLDKQKGQEYLLEAAGHLAKKHRDFRILLVGDGDRREIFQSIVADLGIHSHVIFAGFQSDVVGYYAAIDVKVLPSIYEGLPLCVVEAMAMEKPVIATSVDGTPEVVRHEVNGLLVPAKDPIALAEALEYALDHRDEFLVLGQQGRRWVVERFSLERQIEETEALYERLCANSR